MVVARNAIKKIGLEVWGKFDSIYLLRWVMDEMEVTSWFYKKNSG
jgi:hypothetical protein